MNTRVYPEELFLRGLDKLKAKMMSPQDPFQKAMKILSMRVAAAIIMDKSAISGVKLSLELQKERDLLIIGRNMRDILRKHCM